MNYRHAFHAGGFADVIKHIVLVRILTHLQEKPAPFRVIDSHAGAGIYDLTGDEARRGGEWLTGIARIMQARFSETTAPLIKPYLDIVRAFNPGRDLQTYPGSPLIARALLRPQDRLVACEVEAGARKRLIDALRRDRQGRVVDLDGWMALPAFVPPKERRGLVLIDPSFEQKDEFERLAEGFAQAFAKWPTGSYLLWYPVKSRRATDGLARHMPAAGVQRGAAAGRRGADIGRSAGRQSAVAARRRTQGDPARTGKAARPGRRRPVQVRGAQALSRQMQAPGVRPKKSRRQLTENRIMLRR
jgi:23S rRNA (adenine2030-N6)-methyltransferase